MIDSVLFIALPYLAVLVCIFGSIFRVKMARMSYSSLSSQFLESKTLAWGSLPWHIGIILIILAHFLAFLFPNNWQSLISNKSILLIIESAGLALGFACLFGLIVLTIRRITCAKIQAVTSKMDLFILFLLLAQIICGLGIALIHRWGAAWASGTLVPYLWSLCVLQPDTSYVTDMPHLVKTHIILAYVFLLVVPFSRLIHIFALPIHYLHRPPQQAIWNNPRHIEMHSLEIKAEEARREFIKGGVGIAAGLSLLSVGALDKIFQFFFGPRLSPKEESELMALKLERLKSTSEQRKLELERQTSKYILVASLDELKENEGKYFIDYQMSPALAFKDKNGLPIIVSAKCTHLGCTVGNEVNAEGKVLCPCHISFFDIHTGMPNADAPAKTPLPIFGWVLMDKSGKLLARRTSKGSIEGNTKSEIIAGANVYIVKSDEDKV